MNKLILILSAIFLSGTLSAQLTGAYTVGATGDYLSIQEACTDLETQGQSGPVIFNIQSSEMPYVEAITLNAVDGNSSTNTITFQSEVLDSSEVLIESNSETTFEFNDVSYVNFNHLTIIFDNPEGSGNVINVDEGTNFAFDHVLINQLNSSDAIYMERDAGIFSTSFVDCDITAPSTAVYLYSGDGNIADLTVDNSSFNNNNGTALDLYAQYHISNTSITNTSVTSTDGYGIYMYSSYGDISELDVSDCEINTKRDGLYAYGDVMAENITIVDNSLWNNPENLENNYYSPVYIEGYYGGINNVLIDNNYFESGADYSDYAIYLYSGDGQMNNAVATNNEIASGRYGIYFESYGGSEWYIDNNEMEVKYDGIYGYCYGPLLSSTVNDNNLTVLQGDGVYYYVEASVQDFMATGNTIESESDGIRVEGYGGGIMNCLIEENIVSSDDGIYLETNANISNLNIRNNEVNAFDEALYIESDDANIDGLKIVDNTFTSIGEYGYGIYVDANAAMSDITLTGNTVTSYYEAAYFEPYYGGLSNMLVDDNNFTSTNNYGLYLYTDEGIHNVQITNNEVSARYEAVYLEAYYAAIEQVEISDNIIESSEDDGLYMESNYAPFDSVYVTNNVIYGNTTNCCDAAIYMEADDSYMQDVVVTKNDLYSYGYGMEIEADYGNALNCAFDNNNIWAGDYAIEVDGLGENSSISRNNIYPHESAGDSTYAGIYVYGYDGPTTGAKINDNYMENVYSYGIEADYMEGVEIQRNKINATEAAYNLYGIYLYSCYGENTLVNANQILATTEYIGLYVYDSYFDPMSPAVISNNFVSNMEYSIDAEYSGNIHFANNTMVTGNNSNMVYLYDVNDVTFMNNIFRETEGVGSIYYMYDNANLEFDYNVYDFNDETQNIVDSDEYGLLASLSDFQTASSMEASSFELDLSSILVNDDTDLHVQCATTTLNAGMALPYVFNDVDGFARPGTDVTIGAHEMNGSTPDILAETALMCAELDLYMMNPIAGTYEWSTNETTESITVTEPGVYSLTVTDECGGTHTDEIEVYVDGPDASFLAGNADLTGLFSNTSEGAISYNWTFGDGATSEEENPTHEYDAEGTYTVTLTVTDACGNTDTASYELNVFIVGVAEWLSEENVNIYPNPTQGMVTVSFNQLTGEDLSLTITDMKGRVVYTDQNALISGGHLMNLDISEFADGVYIFTLQTENAYIAKRVIKK